MRRSLFSRPSLCLLAALPLACWLAALPTTPAQSNMPAFIEHKIADFKNGYQVAVSDMNGDGKLDVIALSTSESRVVWFENSSWREHLISSSLRDPISVWPHPATGRVTRLALAADFGLDRSRSGGRVYVLDSAGAAGSEWESREIDAIPTSHRVKWADLLGDGTYALVNAPLLGYGAKAPGYTPGAPFVYYREADGWKRHELANGLRLFHGLAVVKADGGKRDALLSASDEGVTMYGAFVYDHAVRFKKTRLADGPASEVCLGTTGGRRFIATIEPWHGNRVVVYREMKPGRPDVLWERHVLDESLVDGHAIACGDINGDGHDEIVAGFRGKGTSVYAYFARDNDGQEWQRVTVDPGGMAAAGIALADINRDGRLDIVAIGASTNNVKWYELK